jgi:hypothetical protein
MTKNQLIYTVIDRVKRSGKIDYTKIHPIDVSNVIAKYRSNFIKGLPENELDKFAKSYTESVQSDGTTSRKYVDLSIQIEGLNRVGGGVVSISTSTGYDFKFYPTTERDMKLYNGLEVNDITTKIGFIVRYDRIDFDTKMDSTATVRLMLIPTFDEYGDTENIPLGKFEKDILEGATNYLLGTPEPEHLTN